MNETPPHQAMYVPPAFAAPDPRAIIAEYPFGLVVTSAPDGPFATALPIYFETDAPDEARLVSHISRANPHASALRTGDPMLMIFSGPHAYVSASWYEERPTVPTWNYVSAQARGIVEVIDDREGQLAVLRRTAQMAEYNDEAPWTIEQAPPGRVDQFLPRIRSFRLTISRLDGATKLSQTQPPGDRVRVWEALERRGGAGDLAVARLMRSIDGAGGSGG